MTPSRSETAAFMRRFRESDWVGAFVACPHCGEILKVTKADGPCIGFNPEMGAADRFWILTFTDGATARMWEDRKGVVLGERGVTGN